MSWLQSRFSLPASLADALEDNLLLAGYDSYAYEREPGGRTVQFSLFGRSPAELPTPEQLAAWIGAAGGDASGIEFAAEPLIEEDWTAGFRSRFGSREITELVRIVPPWEERPDGAVPGRRPLGPGAKLSLVIEPAQAFGTGEHPTTTLCLDRMGELFAELGGCGRCIDVGSGTGILSIAAYLWGAERVEGYDVEPACIVNSHLNADLNGLAGRLRFRWGEPSAEELSGGRWDVLLCNLFLGPILRLLPRFDAALAAGGYAILSGFLNDQAPSIQSAAEARGWELLDERERDGWMVQVWRKP